MPAGATSFSRLFSGLQISPALTLQLLLPPGQRLLPAEKERLRCQGQELRSRGKRDAQILSVCLGIGIDAGTAGEEGWALSGPLDGWTIHLVDVPQTLLLGLCPTWVSLEPSWGGVPREMRKEG